LTKAQQVYDALTIDGWAIVTKNQAGEVVDALAIDEPIWTATAFGKMTGSWKRPISYDVKVAGDIFLRTDRGFDVRLQLNGNPVPGTAVSLTDIRVTSGNV
jgi:hypothetical protein